MAHKGKLKSLSLVTLVCLTACLWLAGCASRPPASIASDVFGLLERNQGETGNGDVFFYYVTNVDIPPHEGVVVVLHFDENVPFNESQLLAMLEPRFVRLSGEVDALPLRAAERIHKLYVRYYGDEPKVEPANLTTQLRLTHIKLIANGDDELIYYGNEHYLSHDLNMAISPEGEVVHVWFDG